MAVIRAKRLWAALCPESSGAITGDAVAADLTVPGKSGDVREPGSQLVVYTCPSGKRAIIRTMTFYSAEMADGYYAAKLVTGAGFFYIHCGWWHKMGDGVNAIQTHWHASEVWSGQLVLHSGDSMVLESTVPAPSFFGTGSGHELNEIT